MRSYTDFSSLKTNSIIEIGPLWGDWPEDGGDLLTSAWHGPSLGLAPLDMLTTMRPLEKRWWIGTKKQIPYTDMWVRLVSYTHEPPFYILVIRAEGWRQWLALAYYLGRGFAGNIANRILWTLVVWGLAEQGECRTPMWSDVVIVRWFFRDDDWG